MQRRHFEELQPICPRCYDTLQREAPLVLAAEQSQTNDNNILEGALICSDNGCRMEFPIIDGIPLLTRDPSHILRDQLYAINARRDLSATTLSRIGDAVGQAHEHNQLKQILSIYAWDGYAQYASHPPEHDGSVRPGAVARCLEAALGLADPVAAPIADLGCSTGRSTFELAQRSDGLVLGVDLSFAALQMAQRALTDGQITLQTRQVGVSYQQDTIDVPFGGMANVDFWLCEADALPFPKQTFSGVVALNLLDCMPTPLALLNAIADYLKPGGQALFSTPYDWSENATAMPNWIGGHSQRGDHGGASEPLVRALLTPGAHPQSIAGLALASELEHFHWQTRLHARSTVTYDTHLFSARKS